MFRARRRVHDDNHRIHAQVQPKFTNLFAVGFYPLAHRISCRRTPLPGPRPREIHASPHTIERRKLPRSRGFAVVLRVPESRILEYVRGWSLCRDPHIMEVDDISDDIWSILKAIGVVHASASRHNLKARRDACKQLVIMWCAMVTTNDKAAVAEFESNWGLDTNQSDTPDT